MCKPGCRHKHPSFHQANGGSPLGQSEPCTTRHTHRCYLPPTSPLLASPGLSAHRLSGLSAPRLSTHRLSGALRSSPLGSSPLGSFSAELLFTRAAAPQRVPGAAPPLPPWGSNAPRTIFARPKAREFADRGPDAAVAGGTALSGASQRRSSGVRRPGRPGGMGRYRAATRSAPRCTCALTTGPSSAQGASTRPSRATNSGCAVRPKI